MSEISLSLKEGIEETPAVKKWLKETEKVVNDNIDWDKIYKYSTDLLIYGHAEIEYDA
jgi:hypothetical protein